MTLPGPSSHAASQRPCGGIYTGNVWQTLPIGLPRSAHMPKRGHLPGDGLQAATLKGPVRFQQ